MSKQVPVAASNAEKIESPRTTLAPPWIKLLGGLGALVAAAIYFLRVDEVVGLTADDAWYVLLAKGLATGQGFTAYNSPTPGILPLYPPGFPFLLSLVYRCAPNFPQNVFWLKLVSIASMGGTGALVYYYFTRIRQVSQSYAGLLALATVLCPPLVFLATSTLMSECVFSFLLMATLFMAEQVLRVSRQAQAGKWKIIGLIFGCAALASYAFLTRTAAVALVGTVFLYLLGNRQIRSAFLYAVMVGILLLPWLTYSRLRAPTYEQQREQGGQIVMSYSVQFWQRMAAMTTEEVTWQEIPLRVWRNVMEIAGRDVLRIIATPVFEKMQDPYYLAKVLLENNAAGKPTDEIETPLWASLLLSIFVVWGFITAVRERLTCAELAIPGFLFLIVLWPWETIRFVLPLTPFLLFYWAAGLKQAFQRLGSFATPKRAAMIPLAAVALSLLINLTGHANYLYRKTSGVQTQWSRTFTEVEKMLSWVQQNVPASETVVTFNPALVHLYTGHKTVAWESPLLKWNLWRSAGIRYLVRFGAYAIPEDPELKNYPVIYSGKELNMKVVDLGTAETRLPWGAATPLP